MKRLLSAVITLSVFAAAMMVPLSASAETVEKNVNNNDVVVSSYTEHYEDGSYAEITVTKCAHTQKATTISAKGQNAVTRSSTWFQDGSKTFTWYNKDGTTAIWFAVHGTFSVTGTSSNCIDHYYDYKVYERACSVEDPNTYAVGNQAVGTAKLVRKYLFVTVGSKSVQLVLRCDLNGHLS